jgi:hypothetical protein
LAKVNCGRAYPQKNTEGCDLLLHEWLEHADVQYEGLAIKRGRYSGAQKRKCLAHRSAMASIKGQPTEEGYNVWTLWH